MSWQAPAALIAGILVAGVILSIVVHWRDLQDELDRYEAEEERRRRTRASESRRRPPRR